MENKTFDIRQSLLTKSKQPNKDIIILAIDDASYEYILDNYGQWPLSRSVYADLITYLESYNPKSIVFDLMFVKSLNNDSKSDEKLGSAFKKYKNVYTAMNLDNQDQDLRKAPILPDKLSAKIENNSKRVDLGSYKYTNCRSIIDPIINSTSNIGMINVSREDDGILRSMPSFLNYNGRYYPQLGLKIALDYLKHNSQKEFVIDKDGNLLIGDKKIYLDNDSDIILNWYGQGATFENIPIYKVLKSINSNNKGSYDFHNKIIYIGATASSLFDIKTTPVDKIFPGVEVQATYVNNLIDSSVIRKTSFGVNVFVNLLLILLTAGFVFGLNSLSGSFLAVIGLVSVYLIYTYELMKHFNMWAQIVNPIIFVFITLILALCIKYLLISKDFDKQYKLATTDGLTELYNHRFFQEQMKMYVENAARYNNKFSLLILDIDYFKKFNDNYGHQSGDAVLKQVSFELKKNVRSSDIVCRYGGEEISIILPNTEFDEACKIANKLCSIISSKEFQLANGKTSNVTVSIGVSTYGDSDGVDSSSIIDSADKRLYNAKQNGRNRVN